MNKCNGAPMGFEDGNLDAKSEAERETRALRCLIGELLKTNQELREALMARAGADLNREA